MLTKAKLLRMPAKKYMAKEQLEFFTALLNEQKAEAVVEIDGKASNLNISQSIDIPLGSIHRLSNETNSELIIIEIQFGEYLGEDDIIRYEDDFNRV